MYKALATVVLSWRCYDRTNEPVHAGVNCSRPCTDYGSRFVVEDDQAYTLVKKVTEGAAARAL